MGVVFDARGFKKLARKLEGLDGKQVRLDELFPPYLMKRYTDFATFQAMVDAWGKDVPEGANFGEYCDDPWLQLVKTKTRFKDWEEMKSQGAVEYAKRELEL